MNKGRKLLKVFRFPDSLYSSQISRNRPVHQQVSLLSNFSNHAFTKKSFFSTALCSISLNQQRLFFSSKPESLLSIFSSEDWPNKLNKELEDSNLLLNHETVMYVLKNLSKDTKAASRFFKWVVEENGFEPSSSIYSLMLRIYAGKNSTKEFWVTIKEMKEKGFYVDEGTYKTIFSVFRNLRMENEATALRHFYMRLVEENCNQDCVKEVVDAIKSAEWGEEVERALEAMNIRVSDNFVLRVLKELRGKGYPLRAYTFFKWVDKSLGFKHNTITYNGVLRVLCWEESINELWGILEEMNTTDFELDLDTYIKISRQLQKNKMLGDAVKLYEHMLDSPFKPSVKECGLLLRAIATERTPDLDLAYRVVNKFKSAGNSPSKAVYDGIHRCLTSLGKFDEAEKIVETMRISGYEPDNITYSQLVFGLIKTKKFDEANDVLHLMEEEGCTPDIKTWTILIKGHCDVGQLDKALLCFAKMMEKGFDADADLLDVLLNGFLYKERTIGAYQVLVELSKKTGLKPWQSTYKNLIEKLLVERKLEEAMELLRLMKKHKYPTFPDPFVSYISKFGTVDDALDLLKALSGKEHPSVSAYQHVFKSFLDEGRHSEAKDMLFKCPHHIRKHPAISSFLGSSAV